MFNHKRIVGFGYAKKGGEWHLDRQIINAEVATIIGYEVFSEIPVVRSHMPPWHVHLRRLVLALAAHEMDGGTISEVLEEEHYRVEVEVLPRAKKPGKSPAS